mgnify:CR=1 FL=1|tara:strand:- start:611 stop:970 length:360 start_codon:yes stop_codon:yes gene_type:complete
MSLSYDLTGIKNYEDLCWYDWEDEKLLSPVTESIVFATMYVDIGAITKSNAEEFYTRYVMFCRASGMTNKRTLSDIENHIGLRTNVSTETKAEFGKKVLDILRDGAETSLRYSKRKGGE